VEVLEKRVFTSPDAEYCKNFASVSRRAWDTITTGVCHGFLDVPASNEAPAVGSECAS